VATSSRWLHIRKENGQIRQPETSHVRYVTQPLALPSRLLDFMIHMIKLMPFGEAQWATPTSDGRKIRQAWTRPHYQDWSPAKVIRQMMATQRDIIETISVAVSSI